MSNQHFVSLFYGNEDRSESIDLYNFECPKKAAEFLRKIADNIESYKTSYEYRNSKESIFKGTEFE